jgi:hypothetical protein
VCELGLERGRGNTRMGNSIVMRLGGYGVEIVDYIVEMGCSFECIISFDVRLCEWWSGTWICTRL